jgi:hypothetical protein
VDYWIVGGKRSAGSARPFDVFAARGEEERRPARLANHDRPIGLVAAMKKSRANRHFPTLDPQPGLSDVGRLTDRQLARSSPPDHRVAARAASSSRVKKGVGVAVERVDGDEISRLA